MVRHIQDHEVNQLSMIATNLKRDYVQDQDRWSDSLSGGFAICRLDDEGQYSKN